MYFYLIRKKSIYIYIFDSGQGVSTSKPAISYCLLFSGSDRMLYEYATSLKSSEASGLLAFLSGWYLPIISAQLFIHKNKYQIEKLPNSQQIALKVVFTFSCITTLTSHHHWFFHLAISRLIYHMTKYCASKSLPSVFYFLQMTIYVNLQIT